MNPFIHDVTRSYSTRLFLLKEAIPAFIFVFSPVDLCYLVLENNRPNDNVYGAVITTMVTARVHPVHLMNAD